MVILSKKTEIELKLLTNPNILLMVEDGIRSGKTQSSHRYAYANNKYMNDYDENKESSYLVYLDADNLCVCAMSQEALNG